jgi:hypothetical protein
MHHQQRLERYFKWSSPSRPKLRTRSFLDLPASVRRRIYEAAQIIPSQGAEWGKISLGRHPNNECHCLFDTGTEEPYEFNSNGFDAAGGCHRCLIEGHPSSQLHIQHVKDCTPLPLGLFSTCTALYHEVVDLFYSQNRFEIVYDGPATLSVLEKLGPRAIASLQSLTVHMSANHCHKNKCNSNQHQLICHPCCKAIPHDEPLGSRPGSRSDKMAVEAFRRACRHLGAYLLPNQLRFSLSCEVQSSIIASQLLSCLDTLPTLESCIISLSRDLDPLLREMAQETSLRLSGYPESRVTGSFPLRQLPRELQLRILGLSDLVAPFHVWYDAILDRPDLQITTATCVYEKPMWGHATPFGDSGDLPVVCCCSSGRHSTSSWVCNHWHFPTALFAVDHLMLDDARSIMYRGNSWIGFPRGYSKHQSHLHAIVRANTLRFLGEIRYLACNLIPGWSDTAAKIIETVLTHCNVGKLTLVLRLPHPIHHRKSRLGDTSEALWRPHRELMDHMKLIMAARHGGRRLKAFFVEVVREHAICDDHTGQLVFLECSSSNEKLEEAEYDLEQMVVREGFASDASVATKHANVHSDMLGEDIIWPWLCATCVGQYDAERLSQTYHHTWLYHG